MRKPLVVCVALVALSSMLIGCPDKSGSGANSAPSATSAAPANAPAPNAPAAPAPKTGGGW
jgi:hypothetical protein